MSPILLHAVVGWRLGVRSNALKALLVLGIALMLLAYLAGLFSLRQPLVVAVDMGFSGLRFLGLLLVLFWMQEAFAKDIDRRTITFALSYPVPRSSYVIGRFLGVMALVCMAIGVWGGLLYCVSQISGWNDAHVEGQLSSFAYLLTLLGIVIDLMVVGAVFVMLTSFSETPLIAFVVSLGFALAARSMGIMIDYLSLSKLADPTMKETLLPVLEKLRWFLPDLSRLDWRQIVLYGHWPPYDQMLQGVAVACGYAIFSLSVAIFIYRSRSFS